jgi:PAS domain S-box-containing protein
MKNNADLDKTVDQLLDELQTLRGRLALLEHTANGHAGVMTELRQEKQQFTYALETIADGVVLYGMDGRSFFANPAAQAILGVPRGELVNRPFDDPAWPITLLDGTPVPGAEAVIPRTLQTAKVTYAAERLAVRPDGTHIVISMNTAPLRDPDGSMTGVIVSFTDITRTKRLEEELRRASAELEDRVRKRTEDLAEADRRKDEFLATLAHELRNPLAPIRNSLQILKMARVDAATADRAREMMERQVHQLVRLVDDLLDVSRVMRGKIDLRRERVELAAVMARAVETTQPLFDTLGHELEIAVPAESLLLEADPVRLSQVFGNLLTNAAKYTERGGRVSVAAERDGPEAVVRVRDSGIGIAPEMLSRIFELFVQADPTTTKAQGGLGIGLTLVKSLVEMHQGTIAARSDGVGQGSEFVVRLPLAPPAPEEPKGRPGDGEGQISGSSSCRRVVVVDDNRDAADSLALLLRLQGHEVQVAHDGPTALKLAALDRPEMVFLDIGMPGMDGYEVARKLRQTPGLEAMVLVAVTGWGTPEARQHTADAGFDFHLTKPVEPRLLDDLLARPHPPRQG